MTSSPPAPQHHAAARYVWAICFGVTAVIALVAISLRVFAVEPAWPDRETSMFYVSALINLGALLRALFVQDRLRRHLLREMDDERREGLVYEAARGSALPLTFAGLLAVVGIVATGGWGQVLLLFPIFAFAVVFRPGSRTAVLLVESRTRSSSSHPPESGESPDVG